MSTAHVASDVSNDDGSTNKGNNLHVSGLARSITDRVLEDHFSKVGKIVKAQVMLDPHTRAYLSVLSLTRRGVARLRLCDV